MKNKYFKYLLIALVVCFIVPQITLAAWWNPTTWNWGWINRIFHFQQQEQKQEQQQNQVACTMEAKLCPDGTSVGREGPNCEFKACPEDKKLLNDVYPLFSNLKWTQPGPSPMQRLPGNEVTATGQIAKNIDAREFFNYYDKKLKALGWAVDNSFSADGVTGSQVGYKKDNDEIVLSYNIKPGKVTSSANEPLQYTCPCDVTYTIFTTNFTK